MKNIQLVFAMILINGLFLNLNAQDKRLEISTMIFRMDLKKGEGSLWDSSFGFGIGTNLSYSQSLNARLVVGGAIGIAQQNYQLDFYKTVHELDERINFTDRPDFSRKSFFLDEVKYKNQYLNVPLFVKIGLTKKRIRRFRPWIGLRMDNYFLVNKNSKYDFDGADNYEESFLGDWFGPPSWVNNPNIEWDHPSASQKAEIKEYYEQKNNDLMVLFSPSVHFDFHFKRVDFGIEPFMTYTARSINSAIENQEGAGVRTHFKFKF